MDSKSAVVKSKSNSGIAKKSKEVNQNGNKKSRSNADFPPKGIKKRGVYVEKRLTKINLANDKKADSLTKKPPVRPRAGQKKFLASVLTILSKSTAGTQFPEADGDEQKEQETTSHEKDKTYKNKPCAIEPKGNDEDTTNKTIDKANKKETFKSRVLNKKFVRQDKKMVVLQSRKEIARTSSNYSEWSNRDPSQKSNASVYLVYDDDDTNKNQTEEKGNTVDDLRNAILEGISTRKVKKLRYIDDEPNTLVSDGPKDQKNLYNFFVDLLETTISVYNIKTEYDVPGPSDVSKTCLQINESVANKLNAGKDNLATEMETSEVDVNPIYSDSGNEINNEDILNMMKTKPSTTKTSRQALLHKKDKTKNLKTNSFIYQKKTKTASKTSKSLEINRKTKFKNKKDLINVLKQELEIGTHVFEEPKSIFQALKVMARNKKKISFEPNSSTDECLLKRRKIISPRNSKRSKNKFNPVYNFNKSTKSEHGNRNNILYNRQKTSYNKKEFIKSNVESCHSLEVFDVDYSTIQPKTSFLNRSDGITFTYHSSSSEFDFDANDAILNPTSQYSSVRKF